MKKLFYVSTTMLFFLLFSHRALHGGDMTMDLTGAEGKKPAAILAGDGLEEYAEQLHAMLKTRLGREFPVMNAAQVMEENNWRLREEYRGSSFLLMGNVHNNRAIFALFSRYLSGVNASFPGEGKYIIRTVFQPFDRGAHMLILGASADTDIEAGIIRLSAILEENGGVFGPLIETGPETTQWRTSSFGGTDFIRTATQYYWSGNPLAGKRAAEILMNDINSRERGLFWSLQANAHYSWEGHFRALFQLMASGILDTRQRKAVEMRMLDYALHNSDQYGQWALTRPSERLSSILSRHMITALTGMFMLYEYLDRVADIPEADSEEVSRRHQYLRGHILYLLENGRFNVCETGVEGSESLNNLAALYLHIGDGRAVTDNLFRNMAKLYINFKDNMNFHVGDDSYITCRPGAHEAYSRGGLTLLMAAHFYRDGGYRWLLDNQRHNFTTMQVRNHPEIASLAATINPVSRSDDAGLFVSPADPFWQERIFTGGRDETGATDGSAPITTPNRVLFDKAVLRDGFMPEHAYLALQGINTGGTLGLFHGFTCNAILRYSEHGSILLFGNTMRQTSWARNVVSTSRGANDLQSTAAFIDGSFSTPVVSGIASVMEQDGGASWRRSLIRRHNGYFIVIDRMTALHDDTYNFTCRWRSLPQGNMLSEQHFQAIDPHRQVKLNIKSCSPVTWDVTYEQRDGAARPTVLRQLQQQRLASGENAVFHNLVYSETAERPASFDIRSLSDDAVIVQSPEEHGQGIAAAGSGNMEIPGLRLEGSLWYVSESILAVSDAKKAAIDGLFDITTTEAGIALVLEAGRPIGSIENSSGTPVTVTINMPDGKTLLLAERPASGTVVIMPGVHTLAIEGVCEHLAMAASELRAAWTALEDIRPLEMPALEVQEHQRLNRIWAVQAGRPAYMQHGNVRFSAEPEIDIGYDISNWGNRRLDSRFGLGWHGSERAGWKEEGGTIIMDLGEPVDVSRIRLVRSRRRDSMEGAFNPGEFFFDIQLSNDNFHEDIRKKEIRHDTYTLYLLNPVVYGRTRFFPCFDVPVYETARYIRLTPLRQFEVQSTPDPGYSGNYADDEVAFMEIEVYTTEYEKRLGASLMNADFGLHEPVLLHQAGSTLKMLNACGNILWQHDIEAAPACDIHIADYDGDAQPDIQLFTLAERLFIIGADGAVKKDLDLFALAMEERTGPRTGRRPWWVGGQALTSLRARALGTWRPDTDGRKEVLLFHHTAPNTRILPDNTVSFPSTTFRGGRYAFNVPDADGDGLDDLAVIGGWQNMFGILSSASLQEGSIQTIVTGGLTGHFSGNNELQLYCEGTNVYAEGVYLGIAAVSSGGVDFFQAPRFQKRWSQFNHASNLCKLVIDITGDGLPEILTGREDGYVVAYSADTGAMLKRKALDGPVLALDSRGELIVAGTENGLSILDKSLNITGYLPGGTESVKFIACKDGRPILIAAHSCGTVAGYRLEHF